MSHTRLLTLDISVCSRQANCPTLINQKGFSLVEVLLYIGIFGILILTISGFFAFMINSKSKGQVIMEVNDQGSFLVNLMTQKIRNAENINSPSSSTSGDSINLDVVDVSEDPTVFSVSGQTFYITKGAGSSIAITNNKVLVSNVNFNNVSLADTPGLISFQFTLSHVNPEGRQEYEFSKTFYGSASLR